MTVLLRAFGRDEHVFVLKVRGWREVEKACDAGLGVLAARLAPLVNLIQIGAERYPGGLTAAIAAGHLGSARLDDVREPLLQGLIDGGMPATQAGALVRVVFDELAAQGRAPMLTFAFLAWEIVSGALIGLPDEPVDDAPGETTATEPPKPRRRSPTGKSASPISTAPPP